MLSVWEKSVKFRHIPTLIWMCLRIASVREFIQKSICVRNVVDELEKLYQLGFSNWYSSVVELSLIYGISLHEISHEAKKNNKN